MFRIKFYQNKEQILDYISAKEINLDNIKSTLESIDNKIKARIELEGEEQILLIRADDYKLEDLQLLIKENIVNPKIEIDLAIQEQIYFDQKVKESLIRLGIIKVNE